MLKVLLIFILLSAQPLFLVSKLKQRFEVALPVCCMFDILIVTAFGMIFKNLTAGLVAVFILAGASLIAAVICERKDLKGFIGKVTTPGFYAWCVGYCLMWAFSYKRFITSYDDFAHWGTFVKHMFFGNKLYSETDIDMLRHKSYPPAVSIFEYMITKIWGSFSEPAVFAATKILLYVCVLPFTKFFNKKKIFKAISLSLISYLSLFIWVSGGGKASLHTDVHLSVMFAIYIFFAIFDRGNPMRAVNCAIAGMTLTLTKVTGFEFALVGMGVYALLDVMEFKRSGIRLKLLSVLKKSCKIILWLLPIIAYAIWEIYTGDISSEMPEIASASASSGKLATIVQWLTLNGGTTKNNVISAAIYLWLTMKMTSGDIPLYNPIIVAGFIAILYIVKKSEKNNWFNRAYTVLMILVPLGYIAYSFSLTVVFLSANLLIKKVGGSGVNSFNRYLASYIGGMCLILLSIAIMKSSSLFNNNAVSRRKIVCFASFAILIMLPSNVFQYLAPLGRDGYDTTEYSHYTQMVKKSQRYLPVINEKNDAKLYFVNYLSKDKDGIFFDYKYRYWLNPAKINHLAGEPSKPSTLFNNEAEWGLLLAERNFTHVLLININKDFISKFSKIFDCSYTQIRNDTLYEVVINNDDEDLPVKLVPVDVPIYSY